MQLVNNATQTNTWASIQHIDYNGPDFDEGSIQLVYADATTAAVTFASTAVNTTNDTATITAHGQVTGSKGALTGSGIPGGLSATNYWLIVVDANTVKFASSLANAVAGTAIDITTQGSGTNTFTPTALSTTGAVAKLQVSNDGTNFTDVTSATVTITAAGSVVWIFGVQSTGQPFRSKVVRLLFTPTTGTVTLSAITCFFKR